MRKDGCRSGGCEVKACLDVVLGVEEDVEEGIA